jgi:predicted Rossmann-fold nucleotide-binding protein
MVIAKTKKKKEKNKTNKNKRTNNLGGSNPSANIPETFNSSQVPLYFPNLIKKSEQGFNAETQNIVTVFSGLSNENGENLLSHCSEVGSGIAKARFTMVCAGASIGCQDSLVQSAIGSGGEVIAVTIPKFAGEVTDGVETIVIDSTDLSERKNVMKKIE